MGSIREAEQEQVAPRVPSGGVGSEFVGIYVSDTSGDSASLTATYLKNGNVLDTKKIVYSSVFDPTDFGFVTIQYVPPNWVVKANVSEVYNATQFTSYSGFKTLGQNLYAGPYQSSNGTVVAAVLTKR